MKKAFAIILAIFISMPSILLHLTACEKGPVGEAGNVDSDRSFTHAGTSVCETEDTVYFVASDKIYNEALDYSFSSSMLYYMDKATGISGPLCGRPECGHDNDSCNAYLSGTSPYGFANYNGRLYWIADGKDYKYYLYSAAYDGTDRQTVRDLGGGLGAADDESLLRAPVIMTAFHRGYAYLTCNPGGIVDGEEKYRNYITAVSLDPGGEDFVILDEETTNWIDGRTQLYGNSLYIFLLDRSKDDGTSRLLRWDIETHALETLFDGNAPFAPQVDFWVTEEGIFIQGTAFDGPFTDDNGNRAWKRSVYFYDFSTGEFESAFQVAGGAGGNSCGFSDGLCVVKTDRSIWTNPENVYDITAYDLNGRTVFADTFDAKILHSTLGWANFAGADENNLYFYSEVYGALICIPIDGSEPTMVHGDGLNSFVEGRYKNEAGA